MGDISKNFSYKEFSVSAQFPRLAKGVPYAFKASIQALVLNVLQPICDKTGWTCKINSGYRSPELNKAVGGVPTSQHTKGEASDCVFKQGGSNVPIIDVIKKAIELKLPFDQMIAYPSFVHFSHTRMRQNRKMVLYNKSYKGERL